MVSGRDIKITIAGKGSEGKILYKEGIAIEEWLGKEGNTNIAKGMNPNSIGMDDDQISEIKKFEMGKLEKLIKRNDPIGSDFLNIIDRAAELVASRLERLKIKKITDKQVGYFVFLEIECNKIMCDFKLNDEQSRILIRLVDLSIKRNNEGSNTRG